MATIRQTFFQECEEQLADLESGLLALEAGDADAETINAIFRAVHSIKGGAGAFRLSDLVQFAHAFETALDHLRSGRIEATSNRARVLMRAADMLADLVAAARSGEDADDLRSAAIVAELAALNGGDRDDESTFAPEDDETEIEFVPLAVSFADLSSEPDGARPNDSAADRVVYAISFRPKPELYGRANDPVFLLRELRRLGETVVRCDTSSLPSLDELEPEGAYLNWTIELTTEKDEAAIRETFEFVEGDCVLAVNPTVSLGSRSVAETANPQIAALLQRLEAQVADESDAGSRPSAPSTGAHGPLESDAPIGVAPTDCVAPAVPRDSARSASKPPTLASAANSSTIRVEIDRVDRLVNLIGEIVINQAMLSQRVAEAGFLKGSTVAVGLEDLERLTRDIQDSVMAVRAQPIKPVFQRMARIAREIVETTGKSVRLVTDGENTEIDKTLIERLADPLTHLIRNALDHGIEFAESRVAAGKPAEGVLRLSAQYRSGRIVIEVSDDGAGINRGRVKSIAIERGLIAQDAILSDEEIDNLIFLPGFSTSATVSDISGRGVGMDVVKRSIQSLGGRVGIASIPGRGSTFTLSLPLTLAVLDGMIVGAAGQTLVLPLTAIVETLQPKKANVHAFGTSAHVISIRSVLTPLVDVGVHLGFRAEPIDPLACTAILVETASGARVALLVDAIHDQRQIVVKSLETNYESVPGIAAATILGDGRVALILDVDATVARSQPQFQIAS